MPDGILIFGANGCGKTTLGAQLADILGYQHLDIERYAFFESDIPYQMPRPQKDMIRLLLQDISRYGPFVLSAVKGNFGMEIVSMYRYAVFLHAPLPIRLERIEKREYKKYGNRIDPGGDLFEQHQKFKNFVASRSLEEIQLWSKKLPCPVLSVDTTRPIKENALWIASQYQHILTVK
ncbi:MAG: AAA family ATPase [Massiliimalia sp.]|jgi:adenylate kinase family enzyme